MRSVKQMRSQPFCGRESNERLAKVEADATLRAEARLQELLRSALEASNSAHVPSTDQLTANEIERNVLVAAIYADRGRLGDPTLSECVGEAVWQCEQIAQGSEPLGTERVDYTLIALGGRHRQLNATPRVAASNSAHPTSPVSFD